MQRPNAIFMCNGALSLQYSPIIGTDIHLLLEIKSITGIEGTILYSLAGTGKSTTGMQVY